LKRLFGQNRSMDKEYDFVWALDTDIDIQSTDVERLFHHVEESKAPIVGPTFVSASNKWAKWTFLMRREQAADHAAVLADVNEDVEEEAHRMQRSAINILEKPNLDCDYRHTDFVEITAAVLSARVLSLLMEDCANCIHNESDWGLDMVWCHMAEAYIDSPACALIDSSPVNHLDWKSAVVTQAFKDANKDVLHNYRKYWSKVKELDCYKNSQLVVQDAQVTVSNHTASAEQHDMHRKAGSESEKNRTEPVLDSESEKNITENLLDSKSEKNITDNSADSKSEKNITDNSADSSEKNRTEPVLDSSEKNRTEPVLDSESEKNITENLLDSRKQSRTKRSQDSRKNRREKLVDSRKQSRTKKLLASHSISAEISKSEKNITENLADSEHEKNRTELLPGSESQKNITKYSAVDDMFDSKGDKNITENIADSRSEKNITETLAASANDALEVDALGNVW